MNTNKQTDETAFGQSCVAGVSFLMFVVLKGKQATLLNSAVSSPLDLSRRFTLHHLADLHTPITTPINWEVFSLVVITARTLLVHLFIYCQILIYTPELPEKHGAKEIAQASKQQQEH